MRNRKITVISCESLSGTMLLEIAAGAFKPSLSATGSHVVLFYCYVANAVVRPNVSLTEHFSFDDSKWFDTAQ